MAWFYESTMTMGSMNDKMTQGQGTNEQHKCMNKRRQQNQCQLHAQRCGECVGSAAITTRNDRWYHRDLLQHTAGVVVAGAVVLVVLVLVVVAVVLAAIGNVAGIWQQLVVAAASVATALVAPYVAAP